MMNYIQKILLCLLISALPLSALTQMNFYTGYLIDKSGDTTHGLIKNSGDQRNFNFCLFKEAKGEKSMKYYPEELRSYCIEGKRYYVASYEQFMEVLLEGRLSLYEFSTDAKQRYYLQETDGKITTLVNEKTMFSDGIDDKYDVLGDSGNIEQGKHPGMEFDKGEFYYGRYDYSYNVYKETLHNAFVESEYMQDTIKTIKYSDKSLTAAISEFNKRTCSSGTCITYEKDFSLEPRRYGIYTGLGISKLQFTESDIESAYKVSSPYIGAYYNFPFHRWGENLSFQLEFLGRKMSYTKPLLNLPSDINDIQIQSVVLGFPLLLNYRIPLKSFSPVIGAGMEFSANVWSKTNYNALVELQGSDIAEYRDLESKLLFRQKAGYFFDIGGEIKLNQKIALITKLRFQSFLNSKESEEFRNPNLTFGDMGGDSYKTRTATLILGLAF